MRTQHIVLVDGFDDGHHITYLRKFAQALLEQGHYVYEFLPAPERVQQWFNTHCAEHLERLSLIPYTHPKVSSPWWRLTTLWEPLARWRAAAVAIRRGMKRCNAPRIDHVCFLWLDDYITSSAPAVTQCLPFVFPYAWSGIFFHPWHLRIAEGDTRWVPQSAENALRAWNCTGVAVLDAGVVSQLADNTQRRVVFCPDVTDVAVADTGPWAERIRLRAKGRKVVGLLGHLGARKGLETLLSASCCQGANEWLYVFAGAVQEPERTRLEHAQHDQDNVFVIPERIEDEGQFNAAILACDVLFAAYTLFAHSSNLVTKAGMLRTPILVSRGFCMQDVTEAYGLGLAIDEGDADAVNPALAELVAPSRTTVPDYDGFARNYGDHALRSALEELLVDE